MILSALQPCYCTSGEIDPGSHSMGKVFTLQSRSRRFGEVNKSYGVPVIEQRFLGCPVFLYPEMSRLPLWCWGNVKDLIVSVRENLPRFKGSSKIHVCTLV
jgi:hypothetical protein